MNTPTNCPNCGAPLGAKLAYARMLDCDSCGTTILREDEALRVAGDRGVMLDAPSLMALGQTVMVNGAQYTPVGQVRFDYGAGWWDEFWCPSGQAGFDGVWISVDEGDYAVETAVGPTSAPKRPHSLTLGTEVSFDGQTYMLSETDRATCVAFRGALPEVIALGETHDYANFTAPDGALLSLETWDGGHAWYRGDWIDPWKIKVVA